jgi:hypothetical protein
VRFCGGINTRLDVDCMRCMGGECVKSGSAGGRGEDASNARDSNSNEEQSELHSGAFSIMLEGREVTSPLELWPAFIPNK